MSPHTASIDLVPIPTLELAMRVAQLGGWDKVEILTHSSVHENSPLQWVALWVTFTGMYLLPRDDPKGWAVYDVRLRNEADRSETATHA